MKSMKPWNSNDNPLHRIKNEIDELFTRVFDDSFASNESIKEESFVPKCNIEEKRRHYLIEVEVPGVDPKDIQIDIEGNTMMIKGERKREVESEDEENRVHVFEQSYGSFFRSFTLPDNVNTDEIDAKNKNGVLTIKVPKVKESFRRRITIK